MEKSHQTIHGRPLRHHPAMAMAAMAGVKLDCGFAYDPEIVADSAFMSQAEDSEPGISYAGEVPPRVAPRPMPNWPNLPA